MIVEKTTIVLRSLLGEKSTIVLRFIRIRSQRLGKASGVAAMINKNKKTITNIHSFSLFSGGLTATSQSNEFPNVICFFPYS